jgi:small-conductance mechanosensitive channel
VFGLIVAASVLVASVIIFPSVKPATIISSLGIGSVAIGFAFKDILQNLLAGILLLINRPYRRGDQIVVKDFEGTVEHIQSRATLIKTYDGRRVIIPNSDVYTSPVIVNTAFPTRRSQFDVGIGYGDDPEEACQIFAEAIARVNGVEADPAPEVLPWGLADSYVTLRARWWTESKRTNVAHVQARVILALYKAAKEAAIDLPYPTTVMLFHYQSEATDGDRSSQREGWPAGANPPGPRWKTPPKGDASNPAGHKPDE